MKCLSASWNRGILLAVIRDVRSVAGHLPERAGGAVPAEVPSDGTERGGSMRLHLEIRDVVEILRTVAGLEKPFPASFDLLERTSDKAAEAASPASKPNPDRSDSQRDSR